jgi:hypothetical protein
METVADVATLSGSKYLQQLCKHWGHRFTVTYDEHRGEVDFGGAQRLEAVAGDRGLRLTVEAENEAELITLRAVVAEHLQRFAFRETLVFAWH